MRAVAVAGESFFAHVEMFVWKLVEDAFGWGGGY